jgi:hypothetical protein
MSYSFHNLIQVTTTAVAIPRNIVIPYHITGLSPIKNATLQYLLVLSWFQPSMYLGKSLVSNIINKMIVKQIAKETPKEIKNQFSFLLYSLIIMK